MHLHYRQVDSDESGRQSKMAASSKSHTPELMVISVLSGRRHERIILARFDPSLNIEGHDGWLLNKKEKEYYVQYMVEIYLIFVSLFGSDVTWKQCLFHVCVLCVQLIAHTWTCVYMVKAKTCLQHEHWTKLFLGRHYRSASYTEISYWLHRFEYDSRALHI